ACIRWSDRLGAALRMIAPAGRMTLTLYIAHILIGMGTLEELDMLGGQSMATVFAVTAIFCLAATLFAYLWSRRFKRGPVETAMRTMAG
ncbi:MAG: DUF418 domain-containing protein, partial [Pseudomonadota bacterium]